MGSVEDNRATPAPMSSVQITASGLIIAGGTPPQRLLGFLDAVLTALALGGVFFVPDAVSIVYAVFAAITTTVVFAAMSAALEPVGMPALTFPFVLVVWLFVLASPHFPRLRGAAAA